MLRISLFAIAALLAGAVNAQVAGDPGAAAPVVYSGTAANVPGCDSDIRNADGSPVISCVANEPSRDEYAQAETSEYPQAHAYDEAPDYDTSDYYASDYFRPNFYLGVSLLPYDYWSYGFGWPYYGYAPFAYGWPYFGFASFWGGRHWGGHQGWHDHHGHDGYHGPYRYVGHGQYWDQTHASNSNHDGNRHSAGPAFNTAAVNRSASGNPGGAMGNRTLAVPVNSSRFAPAASSRAFAGAGQRSVLPSASYYAAAQSSLRTGAASVPRSMPMARNTTVNTRAANPYWVTSLPSRNYAAYARANSMYRNAGGSATRSGGYAPRSSYATPRAAYSTPQRYSMPSRGYSVQRSAPSYSRGGGGSATHSSGASSVHSSGSSHASTGNSRAHR
jgi:hypothetical protein